MKKILGFSLVACAIISISACSTFNGVNSAWKDIAAKSYSGTYSAGEAPGTYTLTSYPVSASTPLSGSRAELNYNITLELKSGQYHSITKGKALADAAYEKRADGTIGFSDIRVKAADFADMEPYVYANMWPVIKSQWSEKLRTEAQ
jgi:hypothetical protein